MKTAHIQSIERGGAVQVLQTVIVWSEANPPRPLSIEVFNAYGAPIAITPEEATRAIEVATPFIQILHVQQTQTN